MDAVAEVESILNQVYSPYLETTIGRNTYESSIEWQPRGFFGGERHRYLWSDAFGVCNFLSLYGATGERKFLLQAEALAANVHADLGFFCGSTKRLSHLASATSPLLGGLRIGKPQEHEDGQYFHYLTKWLFALYRLSQSTGKQEYITWAVDLATVAHRNFVIFDRDGLPTHMVWKRSVDLEEVLVSNEGNLDPFDGLVVFRLLQQQVAKSHSGDPLALEREIRDMHILVHHRLPLFQAGIDALDLGQALWLTSWFPTESWAKTVASSALAALEAQSARLFAVPDDISEACSCYRLLFREVGAALGVKTAVCPNNGKVGPLASLSSTDAAEWSLRVQRLLEFWRPALFARDVNISALMFASTLLPGVWLTST